jgi:hypothetical protein
VTIDRLGLPDASEGQITIRPVRPASVGVSKQVFAIDLHDRSTDYVIKPGDRPIAHRPNGS